MGGRRDQHVEGLARPRLAERGGIPRRRLVAAAVRVGQRERAAGEVADAVREVRVAVLDELLDREVAVAPGGDGVEQVEAQGVGAHRLGQPDRVDDHARRLGQALPAQVDEAVHVDLTRERHAGRQQECRPQHAMEAADVLADEVERVRVVGVLRSRPRRPRATLAVQVLEVVLARGARPADVLLLGEPPQRVFAIGPAQGREVVEERIGPHVRHVPLGVRDLVGQRDAPCEIRPGHAHVLEPALDHVHHLVPAVIGPDEVGVGL